MKIIRSATKFLCGIQEPAQLNEIISGQKELIATSFVGRSNVGKSSLINALFGNKTARVSKTPGRTREINIFQFSVSPSGEEIPDEPIQTFWFFDLPGYGFAEISKSQAQNWRELMGVFFEQIGRDVLICNVQDARHPHQKPDQQFQEYLINGIHPTFLVLNKMDKLKKQKERAELQKKKKMIFAEYKHVAQIHQTSCENKSGINELESAIVNFCLLAREAKNISV